MAVRDLPSIMPVGGRRTPVGLAHGVTISPGANYSSNETRDGFYNPQVSVPLTWGSKPRTLLN
jgi:hypothetical protein